MGEFIWGTIWIGGEGARGGIAVRRSRKIRRDTMLGFLGLYQISCAESKAEGGLPQAVWGGSEGVEIRRTSLGAESRRYNGTKKTFL